jgi:hypothetical protein
MEVDDPVSRDSGTGVDAENAHGLASSRHGVRRIASADLREDLIGDFRIGVNLLDVVMVFEHLQ